MAKFKVLKKMKVVIIILSSCFICKAQEIRIKEFKDTFVVFNDTLYLNKEDFKIVFENEKCFNILITSSEKLNKILVMKEPIVSISIGRNLYSAKGNGIFSSKIPVDCDYFYPINEKGNIFSVPRGRFNFRKCK